MNHLRSRIMVSIALLTAVCTSTYAASTVQALNPEAIQRLEAERGGTRVSINPATGTARFVRLPPRRQQSRRQRRAHRARRPCVTARQPLSTCTRARSD